MNDHDNSMNNNNHHHHHEDDESGEVIASMTKVNEGDTYPISDNESTTDSTFLIKDEDQGELNGK